MNCEHLEPLMEGLAEGSVDLDPPAAAHLAGCEVCQARVERAREIERFLMIRDLPAPPATFTAGVMALVQNDRWQAERFIDLGFNLAIAAGVLVVLSGLGGLAWSFGFLDVTVDLEVVLEAARAELGGRVLAQVQTVAMAAVVLTMSLALWWWAEADSSF